MIQVWKLADHRLMMTVGVEGGHRPTVLRLLPRGFSALTDSVDICVYRSSPDAK
jgi:hypothetical protein